MRKLVTISGSRSAVGESRFLLMKRSVQLRIDEKIEGRDRILSFRGSADILAMPAVQGFLARYAKDEIRLLLIDLSETEFINSPVWAVITLFARKHQNECRVA